MRKVLFFYSCLIGLSFLPFCSLGQFFLISQVYPSDSEGQAVYSISINNSSNDSIMVLHTHEAELPPFINRYKWEELSENGFKAIVFLGKSNNPLFPEQYRATKTLKPKGKLELYFNMPSNFNSEKKKLKIYYSMLSKKYYADFYKLEKTGSKSALKKCKSLKKKHGLVYSRVVEF
ncbi:MAG: hypothetical protein IPK10_02570 [Bacteroidetes bacterium]|nr:hypothetical protein [Bacteroidota bacterium]